MGALLRVLPILAAFLVFIGVFAYAVHMHLTAARLRRERAELRQLIERLKDLAWDQRELDSHLSTIVIDEIRTYEKKELGRS